MKAKVYVLGFICNLILPTLSSIVDGKNENATIIDGMSSNYTTQQVVIGKPIVIHTQFQNYDQPTLKEYQECHENLEKCKKICGSVDDPASCIRQCPVCPLLVKEEIVVQGINDTDFKRAPTIPLNTTNVIRLTNQIRNIIENHPGNITYNNNNLVHIHQNVSRVGGKYGLGYNNTDPCCIILSSSKKCEMKKFSTSGRCHHKQHRVCGKQCKSRVMMAKRVTQCENFALSDANEDYSEENCHETIKYFPYKSRRKRNQCTSIPSWPYVLCGRNDGNYGQSKCWRCFQLTYYYILNRGIPPQCIRCFMPYSRHNYKMYSTPWYYFVSPPLIDRDYEFEDDFNFDINGWHQDKTKCRLHNESISEDCIDSEGSGVESSPTISNPWKHLPEAHVEYLDYGDEEDDNFIPFEENSRKRRHTFKRSKYSRRYRQ